MTWVNFFVHFCISTGGGCAACSCSAAVAALLVLPDGAKRGLVLRYKAFCDLLGVQCREGERDYILAANLMKKHSIETLARTQRLEN
jgi:hypothetical protein